MTDTIIKEFVAPYLNNQPVDPVMKRRKSLEEAKKDFAYIEYFDYGTNRLLRKPNLPCGLRNIGNTCYFNMFVQLLNSINCLRDTFVQAQPEFVRDPLSTELQCLFAKLFLTKFAYTDPSGVFDALNRVNSTSAVVGDQYDFYEYFSLTLDALEKCLAREPVFEGKDKLLQKVFYGTMTQQLINGKVLAQHIQDNLPFATKFSIINLEIRLKTLEQAFQSFQNYAVEGYRTTSGIDRETQVKSQITVFPGIMIFAVNRVGIKDGKLDKDNSPFTFPDHLAIDRASNKLMSHLSKEEEDTSRQIQELQEAIRQGRNQTYLQSLKKTLEFLELQGKPTPFKQEFCSFPVESDLQPTKAQLVSYIAKLEQNELYLRQRLKELEDKKYQISASTAKNFRNYSLMAVMIHDGNANSGHYFMFIYNENTRFWHRYSDREVAISSQEEVMQSAMGLLKPEMNVSCLVYKSSDIKCDPTIEPNFSQKIRSFVQQDDEALSLCIDRIRLERMLRNAAEVALDEIETRAEVLKTDPMSFLSYFADPSFFFISNGERKSAELYRLRKLINDSSFAEQLRMSKLSQTGAVVIPKIEMNADAQYCQVIQTLKMSLNEECKGNINDALIYLITRRSAKFAKPIVREMLDSVLFLFLLKSCFYVDLMMQKRQRVLEFVEVIKAINKSMPECIYTRQVTDNLRYSLASAGIKYNEKVTPLKLSENIFAGLRPADLIDIERMLNTRFALWIKFYREMWQSKSIINQERRQQEESIQLVQYATS